MGRTGKLKKKSTSVHSRAARRADSPSGADKSLQSVPRVEDSLKPSSVLAVHTNAGVSKKKSKEKKLSRAQRLRQQKGIERAEIIIDQLQSKVAKSVGKAKTVNARKAKWEDLNGKPNKAVKILQREQGGDDDDEQMEEDNDSSLAAPKVPKESAPIITTTETPILPAEHAAVDEDDNST